MQLFIEDITRELDREQTSGLDQQQNSDKSFKLDCYLSVFEFLCFFAEILA